MNDLNVKEGEKVICIKNFSHFRKGRIVKVEMVGNSLSILNTHINVDSAGSMNNPNLAKYYFVKLTKLAELLYNVR